ncbi:nucleotidyltransferase domain-containing protein [Geobacter argillaceus]|uniref:Nucleotidyltransferase n=1 Tax=Geobacter argillaceus TaxID=345631 RepID=A0A562VPE8_9BACT|nr:nucleotidyltransferase [Geobacter argillaceus]TWJ19718.1 hypothetical protein JN12_01519 [Geobacter argillaceus]
MQPEFEKKVQVSGLLERVATRLELSDAQYDLAKKRYEEAGSWLAESTNPLLKYLQIYPQGSASIGTTVRPLKKNEFDIDLVSHVPDFPSTMPPHVLKRSIGERLKLEGGPYAKIVEEKPRCWRLNYANEFHLDITPSVPNPQCGRNGELVPDKKVQDWKESNPKGFRDWFSSAAEKQPRFRILEAAFGERMIKAANIEALPENAPLKGILRRTIQICKHHRDKFFYDRNPAHAPISIILTTLGTQSYLNCISRFEYDTEIDALRDTIKYMPDFIDVRTTPHGVRYHVWNPTTNNENFAERWNYDVELPRAFYEWHTNALVTIDGFLAAVGVDTLQKSMNACFSEPIVESAFAEVMDSVGRARFTGSLGIVTGVGVGISGGAKIPSNTFYGR